MKQNNTKYEKEMDKFDRHFVSPEMYLDKLLMEMPSHFSKTCIWKYFNI